MPLVFVWYLLYKLMHKPYVQTKPEPMTVTIIHGGAMDKVQHA
jgi:hypothetical protein